MNKLKKFFALLAISMTMQQSLHAEKSTTPATPITISDTDPRLLVLVLLGASICGMGGYMVKTGIDKFKDKKPTESLRQSIIEFLQGSSLTTTGTLATFGGGILVAFSKAWLANIDASNQRVQAAIARYQ